MGEMHAAPGWQRTVALLCPSALTIGALCCGMSAMREAYRGDFASALSLTCLSAACDGLDGHMARRLDAVSQFGGELDSLCDLVDFGAVGPSRERSRPCAALVLRRPTPPPPQVPAMIVYEWARQWDAARGTAGHVSDNFLWACCLVYVSCCAYRLARFNVGSLRTRAPAASPPSFSAPRVDLGGSQYAPPEGFFTAYIARAKFFRGVPAPQGALMLLLPIRPPSAGEEASSAEPPYWSLSDVLLSRCNVPAKTFASAWLCILGFLMASTLPLLSSKMLMRDPARESHFRSRSALTRSAKVAAAVIGINMLLSVRSWTDWALRLCSFVELALMVSIPAGPMAYRLVR